MALVAMVLLATHDESPSLLTRWETSAGTQACRTVSFHPLGRPALEEGKPELLDAVHPMRVPLLYCDIYGGGCRSGRLHRATIAWRCHIELAISIYNYRSKGPTSTRVAVSWLSGFCKKQPASSTPLGKLNRATIAWL